MDKHEAPTTHDAISVREPDVPYSGRPGQTRYESVHLVEADGALRSVAVCRAINVQTHPDLKARALSGQLHRLDDGRELALSFVYHDPEARKFALVVPSALAHLELKEWSKLMSEIAEDTRSPVPAYVREMTTVLGIAALAGFIDAEREVEREADDDDADEDTPSRGFDRVRHLEIEARVNLLAHRERALAEQEHALIRMAEQLSAREAELKRKREATNGGGAQTRETDVREPGEEHARNWQEVGFAAVGDGDATVVSDIPRRFAGQTAYDGALAHDGTHAFPPPLPAPRVRGGSPRPPPLPLRPRRSAPPVAPRWDTVGEGRGIRPRSEPPPLPGHEVLVAAEPNDPAPSVAPPAGFEAKRAGEMSRALADDDELWLFVRLDEAHASAFRSHADLVLQYVEVEGYPVVVLSLVDSEPAYALRLALDGLDPADARLLEHLTRAFRARVALYVDSQYIETVTIAAQREGVAQAISNKIAQLPAAHARVTAADAIPRVLEVPPPLRNYDLPFGPGRREASTTRTVLASVEQVAAWLSPEKLAEATLAYSVPHHVIEATIRRVVHAAIAFGVALPDEMLELAVKYEAASDEASAVRDQLAVFRQRVEARQNDLSATATRENWDRLLAAAAARRVHVDGVTWALSRAEPMPEGAEAQPMRVFEDATSAELRGQLNEPLQRVEAIRELCVRGHASAIEPVLAVLDALDPVEAAVALAQLTSFGEDVGDGLVAALSSASEAVRQCAALALGRLQLRRALVPLLTRLEVEESPAHTEIARAFGDFGAPALRSVVRALPTSARPDRLVLALAHLANHGSADEVEKLENDPEGAVAQAARKAMARRARMEWEDVSVREQRTLTDASPAARLSQAFYAEAAKVAI